ncbi:hypothetical protein ACIPUP_08920 [Pectobacterium actinidiae]|uniref:Uncharacterized protein n=1 Tax=Pectobacterium actinidiae TaxID=1507808 RepID=A0ABW8G9N7_9GAMM
MDIDAKIHSQLEQIIANLDSIESPVINSRLQDDIYALTEIIHSEIKNKFKRSSGKLDVFEW